MSKMNGGSAIVILVVDDDHMISRMVTGSLESKGYKTVAAYAGEPGLQMALDVRPSLVILDYNMPDIDGIEVLRRLRQDEWGATVPVIIASNVYDVDIVNAAMELGVQDYVLKSDMDLEQITGIVGKYLPEAADS